MADYGRPIPISPLWYVDWAYMRVRCTCGRQGSIQIRDLIAWGVPKDLACYQVIDRLRCTQCGERPDEADVAERPGAPFTKL